MQGRMERQTVVSPQLNAIVEEPRRRRVEHDDILWAGADVLLGLQV